MDYLDTTQLGLIPLAHVCRSHPQELHRTTLARRHLKNGALLLYDVTSTYLEGRCCELAQHGYSRDHRRDRPQLVIGLLCAGMAARSRSRCSKATPPIR